MDDLLDNAPCGFLAFADDGTILQANATLQELLEYERGEMEGRQVESLLSVGGRVFFQTHLFPLLKLHGRVEEIYLSLRSNQGQDVPVLVNAVRRKRGNAGAFVTDSVLVPMRLRSRYEDEILQAKRMAEEAARTAAHANAELEQARAALEAKRTELVQINARLAQEMREIAHLREREHNIAERLEGAIRPALPDKIPGLDVADHYQPALEESGVGGDFFDVFPFEKGGSALVVADLSGKGLAAASEVATVRNMLRYAVYASGTTLAQAVTTLNHTLVEHHLLTGFATLFVGLYDQNTRTLTYVNCGQEPGLVWRRATGQVEELCATGPVLGGFTEENGYEERTVVLSPGDVLALFTDGLTEAGPNRREMLEIDGVSGFLCECCAGPLPIAKQSGSILSCLVEKVDVYSRGGMRDDIAVLVSVVKGDDPSAQSPINPSRVYASGSGTENAAYDR